MTWYLIYVRDCTTYLKKFKSFAAAESFYEAFEETDDAWIQLLFKGVFLDIPQHSGVIYEPVHTVNKRKKKRNKKINKKPSKGD